ncbi:MAG: PKD domain-containing protein [Bacteroidales bacterium]|nr:PKD domain-containing protein [Bacteroidales bacterium]
MKKTFKWSAILAIAAAAVFACTKPGTEDPVGPTPSGNAPKADFEYVVDGLKVTFTNKSTDATAYKWSFGDEETSKEVSPVHEYAAAGEYTVTLTAANAKGESNKKEVKITLTGKIQAYFDYTDIEGRAGAFGKGIHFDATSSANATSIVWDFGDGSSATEFTVDHIFPEYTTYTVKATVSDAAGATDTYTQDITLTAKNELLKGGSMEEDDAEFWTVECNDATDSDPLCKSWTHTFGYTDFTPAAGKGGAILIENTQVHDQSGLFLMYQPFEVVEGDVLEINADLRWSNFLNSGLVRFGITFNTTERDENGYIPDACAVMDMVNYWAGYDQLRVMDYDGNLHPSDEYISWSSDNGNELHVPEGPVTYTCPQSGTAYFYIDVRNVWGNWGTPELPMRLAIDNVSVKAIL